MTHTAGVCFHMRWSIEVPPISTETAWHTAKAGVHTSACPRPSPSEGGGAPSKTLRKGLAPAAQCALRPLGSLPRQTLQQLPCGPPHVTCCPSEEGTGTPSDRLRGRGRRPLSVLRRRGRNGRLRERDGGHRGWVKGGGQAPASAGSRGDRPHKAQGSPSQSPAAELQNRAPPQACPEGGTGWGMGTGNTTDRFERIRTRLTDAVYDGGASAPPPPSCA